jgi:hypothetical protein
MVALGRLVEHDPQSKVYPARRAARPRTVLWDHHAPVLDQGDLGSCTGNALAQCLNTTKFAASRPKRRYLDESYARLLYAKATVLDDFPGQWPTNDTGSSGLAVAKAGVALGYLSAYQHAFGFVHFAEAIQLQPVIIGSNWYDAMFEPDTRGFVKPVGEIAGGHEYLALGINYAGQYVTCLNSWSDQWGSRGRFRLTFADFSTLLQQDGDVTVPIGKV